MSIFKATQKETLKVAGLATVATALVSFAINKMIEIQLNFWMLFGLLIVGIVIFVYIDIRNKK